jgi:hypothetical protein
LSEYLKDLADLFGEDKYVHFNRLEEGRARAVIRVEKPAEPKVRARLREVKRGDGPPEAIRAARSIDDRLKMDNTNGAIIDPVNRNLLEFPGCERKTELEYGPINQPGYLDGIPIMIGGKNEIVSVHLEGRDQLYLCAARRDVAKRLAPHLFTTVLRVDGIGRWVRKQDGEWEMRYFNIKDFTELENISLRESLERIRAITAAWKELEDPLGELQKLRDDIGM